MKKVLIVEDDHVIAHIYQTCLEKEGYKVEVAADGQRGFYRIHEFEPDAVLLDLMLPKMNGVEILKKIRAEGRYNKTPVIVFTNAYVPNMINESFLAGATLVFNKATLTPRQIVDALHNAIYSAIPADGNPPKTNNLSVPAPTIAPELESTTVGSEGAFHSTPPAFPKAEAPSTQSSYQPAFPKAEAPSIHSTPPSFPKVDAPSTQSNHQTASAVMVSPAESQAEDSEFQAELLKAFLDGTQATLTGLRKITQEFCKAQDETSRMGHLLELYRKVHALTGSAGIAGVRNISKMAAAVEVLLKELYEKPKNVNASTMRTVAHSIDFLAELCTNGLEGDLIDQNPIQILVVDDEILSRRAITYALEKAGLKSASVEEPQVALTLATETSFDLIFLDVQMPGMDGFDLCTKIRALPTNKKTPIIFVTSLTDFKSRAKSTLSGGADLIAKPFMFIELTVKALTYVLRGQLLRKQNS